MFSQRGTISLEVLSGHENKYYVNKEINQLIKSIFFKKSNCILARDQAHWLNINNQFIEPFGSV